jgi:Protein of unknown function (DUF4089)
MTKRAKSSKSKAKTPRARAKARARPMLPKRGRKTAQRDPLDSFVDAAAHALDLKIEPAWKGAIKTNLEATLALAALFADFPLPDDAEPAAVFSA